jgi:hypothetical protein
VSGTAASFNGSANVNITNTVIGSGVIDNDNISASAGIVDTKLATISTTGKVQNGATTATSANTANAIVARDVSGNFTAGTITANLTGNVTGQVSDLSNQTSTIRGLFSSSGDLSYDSASGQFSFSEYISNATELMTEIQANDGASSGLDADKLDGKHGSHYRINVYNSSGTLLN